MYLMMHPTKLEESSESCTILALWVVRVGGDDGELRPWHYTYVYNIERRLTMTPKCPR